MVNEWKKAANYATLLRFLLTIALYVVAWQQNVQAFIVLFILAGVTDALDGYLARSRNEQSPLGAKLDSLADYILYGSTIIWMYWLVPEIYSIAAVQLLFFLAAVYVLLKIIAGQQKFLHLWPSKIAAVGVYVFVLATLIFGFKPMALYALLLIFSFAIMYELHFMLWRTQ